MNFQFHNIQVVLRRQWGKEVSEKETKGIYWGKRNHMTMACNSLILTYLSGPANVMPAEVVFIEENDSLRWCLVVWNNHGLQINQRIYLAHRLGGYKLLFVYGRHAITWGIGPWSDTVAQHRILDDHEQSQINLNMKINGIKQFLNNPTSIWNFIPNYVFSQLGGLNFHLQL